MPSDSPRSRQTALVADADVRLRKALRQIGVAHCPYEPVGFDGRSYFVLDANRFLRSGRPHEWQQRLLVSICNGPEWLMQAYPRVRRGKEVNGFSSEEAYNDLVQACHIMGHWSPEHSIRGRGAWLGQDGELILHRGDHLLIDGQVR